jgi:hypothetical protein
MAANLLKIIPKVVLCVLGLKGLPLENKYFLDRDLNWLNVERFS